MRKLFFRRLTLEELEKRDVPNMIVGQLGITELASSPTVQPGHPSAPAFISITDYDRHATGESWLWANSAAGTPDVTVMPSFGAIPSNSGSITSVNERHEDTGNNPAVISFDPFKLDLFDVGFSPAPNNSAYVVGASLDYAGSSSAPMPTGPGVVDSGSGSSAGGGKALGAGLSSAGGGSLGPTTPPQSAPILLLPPGHMGTQAAVGSMKPLPPAPAMVPSLASGPLHPT